MKRLLILFFVVVSLTSVAQVPQKINTWYEYKLALFDTLGLPTDTVPLPASLKSTRQFLAPHGDTLYMWSIALQKYILISGGAGGGADGNNYPVSISFTNNRLTITRNGTTSIFGDWDSSKYHSVGYYDGRYAFKSHGHTTADISDFLTGVRSSFSAGSGINITGGVIAWTGSGIGISSLNGLRDTAQTLVTGTSGTDFNISSVGTAHTFNIPTVSGSARGLVTSALYNTWNAKLDSVRKRNDSVFMYHGGTEYFAFKDSSGGSTALTQYRIAIGNASNQLSSAAAITGSRALVSDANGVPTHATTTAAQINYLSTTTSDVQTQINGKEASFTETTQKFTGLTVGVTTVNITLSNTPKSGKAEQYWFYNMLVDPANVSRTGTSVTITLPYPTDATDYVIAKYSY